MIQTRNLLIILLIFSLFHSFFTQDSSENDDFSIETEFDSSQESTIENQAKEEIVN